MIVISLVTLIEESGTSGGKNLTGNIHSWQRALEPGSLENLEQQHHGIFAFLAFHPRADVFIADYIRGGTFASDTGPHVLALFTLDADARLPVPLAKTAFDSWLEVDTDEHPAYKMIRILFEPKIPPALPGIVFFGTFTGNDGAVYVPLEHCLDETSVRTELRGLFALASHVANEIKDRTKFSGKMAASLQSKRLTYFQSSNLSMRQWLIKSYQFAVDHKADIVAALSVVL
jgi:hypothetical protein